jgi:malate synthase
MADLVEIEGLQIDAPLHRFVENEAIPGSGVEAANLWRGLSEIIEEFAPLNRSLLETRAKMQREIDEWHRAHAFEQAAYIDLLSRIGYLAPKGPAFQITTTGVDPEINEIAGPQLVVPVSNARYALNAANARWGSLYDALYGTDAIGSPPPAGPFDPDRGAAVIAWCRSFLDNVLPLERGSHADVTRYLVEGSRLICDLGGRVVGLADPSGLAGYLGSPDAPESIFLRHHGLHVELVVDRTHAVGMTDRAGVADVVIESAITTIMDCEDSVAAVGAADKVGVYRNWLGLMKGDLTTEVTKDGETFTRALAGDRSITSPDGTPITLPGRALMLVRNVGHLMTTPAVLDREGNEIPEGILDAVVTVLIAKHDLLRDGGPLNSRRGSVYIVKPKMHGPDEVAFANDLFGKVERVLALPAFTIKLGLMDEERRTTLNLAECIRASSRRIAFINTGFLDRTGDEIHTSMEAGPMVRKAAMRSERWLAAYEDNNVDVGIASGLVGRAQIGKGMWAAPDLMANMLREKIAHPEAGANCAWVPSPTAATLHATHYHRVNVATRQKELAGATRTTIDDLVSIPIVPDPSWSETEIQEELDNNAQGILGYVVRWIDQGIGCSKVPDIHNVALMEDRATCRISSQHIANWLRQRVVDERCVIDAFERMAAVVDEQNAGDPLYTPMSPGFDGIAFRAAKDLALEGVLQPSGYTEPILHAARIARKAQLGLA